MVTIPKEIRQPASKLYDTVSSLKVITRLVKYARVKEEDSGPSCSLAEALEKQDLFINSTLASSAVTSSGRCSVTHDRASWGFPESGRA